MRTRRLLLRRWRHEDREWFAALNADPRVARFLPATLSRAESDVFMDRIEQHFEAHGFGLWAIEVPTVAPLIGYVGLSVPRFTAHFTPCVEIGWRLAPEHWKQGYATEAAERVLAHGFEELGLQEIVSFTVPDNWPSRRVMERLGMSHDADGDFNHPSLPSGHPLSRHVLYRIRPPGGGYG